MRKFYKLVQCIFIFLCLSLPVLAQDPYYTQDFATTLQSNPALAGSKEVARFSLLERLQWLTAMHKLSTSTLSGDVAFQRLGVGLTATHQRNGTIFSHTDVGAAFSYRIGNLKKFIIQPGIQFDYLHRSLDFDNLVFYDQLNPSGGTFTDHSGAEQPYQNLNLFDINAGLACQFPIQLRRTEPLWVNLGAAVHHLAKNDLSYIGVSENLYPRKYVFHGGVLIPLYKKEDNSLRSIRQFSLYPNFQYTQYGDFTTLDIKTVAYWKPFMLGLGVRTFKEFYNLNHSDQLLGTLAYEGRFKDYCAYQISYSCDWAISGIRGGTNVPTFTTHEISLVILFSPKRKSHCINELSYKSRWYDNEKTTGERYTQEERWYDSEKLQRRFVDECPPEKGRRKRSQDMLPIFYPFELPTY